MSMSGTATVPRERELLDAARDGDEDAFRRIVEHHRAELHAHCYRMLGSVDDAEDALQESLLRAWRGLPGFEGRSSSRSWLYKIATNACLDAIARRRRRVLPIDTGPQAAPGEEVGEPLVESVFVEPYPDERIGIGDGYAAPEARYEQREAIELAFVAALQHLPARQRAVLIMREVLGFSAREVAESLETTTASVNSALQRARKTVEERLPERSQQTTLRALGDKRVRELTAAYVDAFERGDTAAVRALLAADAVFSMPPWKQWWRGRDTIASFAEDAAKVCAISRALPVRANGQAALAYYALGDDGRYLPSALDVITFEGELIKDITAFVIRCEGDSENPYQELFARFGLPGELRQ
jgi:RNA polymerase sigma-70 factor, ECF subfamily